ncbi:MAG: hypothetical protein IKH54_05960 [Bacilli bacterium]|nr:hypothetical protein [Bacilli bacterium]
MKKSLLFLAAVAAILCPTLVHAQEMPTIESTEEPLAETTKYFKTVTNLEEARLQINSMGENERQASYSVEISEEEYNNAPTEPERGNPASVETTYKKLTTTITAVSSYYQYKTVLFWKTIPSVRSHDIIGIGMPSNVQVYGTPDFQQYYCYSGGNCYTSSAYVPKTGTYGAGATYKLAEGTLTTLKATFYFDIIKNTSSTLTGLSAAGDYAHATTTVSSDTAQNYSVVGGGLSLNSSISGYYDSIQSAIATMSVYW